MVVRVSAPQDAGVIVDVLHRSFGTVAERFGLTEENCPRHIAFYTEARLREDMDRGMQFYVLEDNSNICGCVALEPAKPGVGYLGRLAVLPPHRSKGFGRTLVRHALVQAGRIGIKRVEIGLISDDEQLKAWYKQFGFVQTTTREFEGFPFTVAFMTKELRSSPVQRMETIRELAICIEDGDYPQVVRP